MEDGTPWGTWGVLGVVWWRCEHVCTALCWEVGDRTWERWGAHLEEVLYSSGSHMPL